MSNNNFNEEETAWARRFRIDWKDIETSAPLFPEHHEKAVDLIKAGLGYLPQAVIYLPHESFIRTLIENYRHDYLSKKEFSDELMCHLKNIRNDDMRKSGWLLDLTTNDYKKYQEYNIAYKHQARERLSALLEYEPSIEHSLHAEIILRDMLSMDEFKKDFEQDYMWTDYRAATITDYRRNLFLYGQEAADKSPLVALDFEGVK